MSATRDLLNGLAGELSPIGSTPPVAAGGTGIFAKALPTSPDRAVALNAYASVDEAKVALSTIRVQFWFRGKPNDPLDVDDLADSAFAILQGLEDRTYGSVHLVQCNRVSSSQMGADESKRSERADNYEIDLDMPTTVGRPW